MSKSNFKYLSQIEKLSFMPRGALCAVLGVMMFGCGTTAADDLKKDQSEPSGARAVAPA